MEFVELETKYFFSSTGSEVKHQTIEEFLENKGTYNFLLLDNAEIALDVLERICDVADSRTILFYNSDLEKENILKKYGHFNVQQFIDDHTSEECLREIERAFFLGQHAGFIAPNEFAIIPSNLSGTIHRLGCYELVIEGDFGSEFQNVCIWERTFETWYTAQNPLRRLWGGETYRFYE